MLSKLTNLKRLGIACTYVSDLRILKNMTKLKVLDIFMTNVTDLSIVDRLAIQDVTFDWI